MAKNEKLISEEKVDAKATKLSNSQKDKTSKKPEKKKKEKSKKISKTVKETTSELKKVNWPTFKTVVKKTGVVLAVVLIAGLILLGIDYLLGLLFNLIN